ncbi:Fiber protein Fb34 [Heracleum sosnowskyi]|uniref:Fiber protein Fb34 n=1 Tax=Heracleum sosnowskyi TaxID=360622 RepID=A0AAD8J0U3_9APIA|nr:Fiber protein Fb34 [Heracleum sosnowskyi]
MASKLVMINVFVFDVIAFGLAVAAEQRRSTATTTKDSGQDYNYCVYDSDISTGLGVGAFLFLLASQAIIVMASRCFCCGKGSRPGGSRVSALLLFVICWLTFIIAEACLLAGSVRNAYHTKYITIFSESPPSCQTVRKGVFAAGAAFTFFTCILSQLYYSYYSKSRESLPVYDGEAGVGLGTYK